MSAKNVIMTTAIVFGMILMCGWSEALTLETDARGFEDLRDGMGLTLLVEDPQSGSGGVVESQAVASNGESAAASSETGLLSAYAAYGGAGGEPHIRLEALASWSETYSNMSGGYMEGLFAIEVLGVDMLIVDYASGPVMAAGYEVEVLLNGAEIWRSRSEFIGGKYGGISVLQEGVSAAYTLTEPIQYPGGPYLPSWMYAHVDPIVDQIALGPFASGDSFTLSYSLFVWAEGPGFETGSGVGIIDPYGDLLPVEVMGLVSLDVNGRPPIPEPASLGIIALGLAGLVIRKRSMRR
ncbi:MAG: PEP-CTERM sorting domain-containing protein [Candidatus Hydrogenedentes bacterium]|nr:PEP-CTERM sorting domain-containing protein [Candidatus Hydrogenedentota bacterium]